MHSNIIGHFGFLFAVYFQTWYLESCRWIRIFICLCNQENQATYWTVNCQVGMDGRRISMPRLAWHPYLPYRSQSEPMVADRMSSTKWSTDKYQPISKILLDLSLYHWTSVRTVSSMSGSNRCLYSPNSVILWHPFTNPIHSLAKL